MKTKVDLLALRYFVLVAETGNYSKAASQLRLTQPAVSRQVQSLESAYGARLLRRDGRRLSVTEAGERLLVEAQAILSRFDGLEQVVGAASKEPSGVLSVGITWATWESFVPRVLASFRARYPSVFLQVTQDNPDRLADALVAHRIDMAVLNHRPRESELEFLQLMTAESGLVLPRHATQPVLREMGACESITLVEALRLPLILPQKGRALRDLIEAYGLRMQVRPEVILESDSLPLSKRLVQAGQGCTISTHGSVHEEVLRGELRFVPIHSPSIPWRMYAATAARRPQTLAQKAMVRELNDFLRSAGCTSEGRIEAEADAWPA